MLGLSTGAVAARAANVVGAAAEVGSNIQHPNGNIYDQAVMTGASASVRADPGQIVRVSFLDATEDIVQVEFSGAGELSVFLHNASAPAPAAKYDQPNVQYVRGHASLAITGSDATTNISIFSVGLATPGANPAIFRGDVAYDGVADLALLTIAADPDHPVGATFGGIRAGNAHFSARSGDVGIYAPTVHVQGVVIISDLTAFDAAIPRLWFGINSQFSTLVVAGGDLVQPNGRQVYAHYCFALMSAQGTRSNGTIIVPDIPPQPSVLSCFSGP